MSQDFLTHLDASPGIEIEELASWRHCDWTVELSDDEEEEEDDEEDEDDEEGGGGGGEETKVDNDKGPSSSSSSSSSANLSTEALFEKAVADILVTGWEKKDSMENLRMEVSFWMKEAICSVGLGVVVEWKYLASHFTLHHHQSSSCIINLHLALLIIIVLHHQSSPSCIITHHHHLALLIITILHYHSSSPSCIINHQVLSLKMTQNKSFEQCLAGCAQALLQLATPPPTAASSTSTSTEAKAFLGLLKQQLAHWSFLLSKLTQVIVVVVVVMAMVIVVCCTRSWAP
jgi:hypothetical protein